MFKRMVLLLSLIAVGCGDDSSTNTTSVELRENVFVGATQDGSALVALVRGDDTWVAYTCGTGDNLPTHTSWYSGLRAEGQIQLVSANSGLRVEGDVADDSGQGTLTLADGRVLNWTVERAKDRSGLYEYEDASKLVGFIRDNTGRTAGNVFVRIGTSAGGITTPISNPVAPSPPPSSPPPPSAPEPVSTTTPTSGTTIISVTPIVKPETRIIKRSGPVVVFLAHGMSDNIGTPVEGDKEDFVACSGPRNTPFYGRCEWGPDFLPGLFGSSNLNLQLTNLAGQDVTGMKFINTPDNRPDIDENQGRTMVGDCVKDPTSIEKHDQKIAKHFIVPGPLSSKTAPPPIAAFVTWRDSTRGLVFSGRRLTRQVYAALKYYEDRYKITPGVILIGQSFGGLASRFLLSRPDPTTLTVALNSEKTKICPEDLGKMDYIRDRTLFLLTLATPHEGSYLAELGVPAKTFFSTLASDLAAVVASTPLARILRSLNALATLFQTTTPDITAMSRDAANALKALFDTPALVDVKLAQMVAFNQGPLSPELARRSGSSPILNAQKTLIPIYVTLARTPGSDAFGQPNIRKGMKAYSGKRGKAQGWITSTLAVDVAVRQLSPVGFGDATVPPYAQYQNILDRRARLFDVTRTDTQFQNAFASDIRDMLNAVSPWFLAEFGDETTNLLALLNGVQDSTTPDITIPIHVDQRWTIGFDGSTINVAMPALTCGGSTIALDYDVLARLLVETFGDVPAIMQKVQNGDLASFLDALGIAIASENALAQGTASWFMDKVNALANLPEQCNLAPNNPFDVFAITELANWRVTQVTGRIPVPAWIPTGEPVSDGEMDNDGAVHSASALGFTLGRVPFFFEHDRRDAPNGQIGSWYRLHDVPEAEKFHHGLQYENSVGLWIKKAFLNPDVGPVPQTDRFSAWIE